MGRPSSTEEHTLLPDVNLRSPECPNPRQTSLVAQKEVVCTHARTARSQRRDPVTSRTRARARHNVARSNKTLKGPYFLRDSVRSEPFARPKYPFKIWTNAEKTTNPDIGHRRSQISSNKPSNGLKHTGSVNRQLERGRLSVHQMRPERTPLRGCGEQAPVGDDRFEFVPHCA